MSKKLRWIAIIMLMLSTSYSFAQRTVTGKIIDAFTKEPVTGASIQCTGSDCRCGCTTSATGSFEMSCKNCSKVTVSIIGYQSQTFSIEETNTTIAMIPLTSQLNEVVVSASRQSVKRSEAPIAISNINQMMIQDARPATVDQVLNKVSGVYMVNLGNEQHQMSIRQPMTTKGLFLYLEDGIPIRTTGLFNHNALLEINMAAVKNIEVIKGPSSSLYGSEAIGGVVNFITSAPTSLPVLKLATQVNSLGYTRADLQSSALTKKIGVVLNGYYAQRQNAFIEYSDFSKATVSARVDFQATLATSIVNTITLLRYKSDMYGTIDSTKFANRSFSSQQTFTYRNVNALRYRSTFSHQWSEQEKTSVSVIIRDNTIEQNPSYSIKNDRRRLSNGNFVGKKELAHGEINNSSFQSLAFIAQHHQKLGWNNTTVISGLSADISPSTYKADYIRINIDTITGKYASYTRPDSVLTNYRNNIHNYAAYLNFECSPLRQSRLVASLRYDIFTYNFDNHLPASSFSGSPDTLNRFSALSPKIGFTYNFSARAGLYANYSQGFVPPQINEMYKGVKVPNLQPSVFYNYETGGWAMLMKEKLSADISIYRLIGTQEIISVRLDDGSTENRNAGKTLHTGIEAGLRITPVKDVSIRFSGAYSKHQFEEFIEKGNDYSGKEMNGAPRWVHNSELWYKPQLVPGLRLGVEWQHVGSYYMDPQNTTRYEGFDAMNIRAGYKYKGAELWVNIMNATNNYYAIISSKSASGYSYTPSEPVNLSVGLSYDFGKLIKP